MGVWVCTIIAAYKTVENGLGVDPISVRGEFKNCPTADTGKSTTIDKRKNKIYRARAEKAPEQSGSIKIAGRIQDDLIEWLYPIEAGEILKHSVRPAAL